MRELSDKLVSKRAAIRRWQPHCRWLVAVLFAAGLACIAAAAADDREVPARAIARLRVDPARVELVGADATQLLLVTGLGDGGVELDFGRDATFRSSDSAVAQVNAEGVVSAAGDGTTEVIVAAGGREASVEVGVRGQTAPRQFHFENQIVPILSKLGCNAGGCHGKAEGQNGFKLSVFGFDPRADFDAIVKEGRGRRVAPAAPRHSLILRKSLGQMPHGGGKRIDEQSREHRTLLDWISAGMPFGAEDEPTLERIEVVPAERVLGLKSAQQLQVTAFLSDGSRRDVTAMANYSSNLPPVASANERGLIESQDVAGEAGVMVSYLGKVAVSRVVVPQKLVAPFVRPPERNLVDPLVWNKLERLGIQPSEPCDDATFLRRVYLDVIGTLPTPAEARAFLADSHDDKRARLVDQLLERPEFVDFWALKWADILRVDRQQLKARGAVTFYEWLRSSIRQNKPYDRFVREILTAQGPSDRVGPANLYRIVQTPEQLASTTSQVFLGIRIECAQCHHHPFDKWAQDDFYGMVGFFNRVQRRADGDGIDVSVGPRAEVKNPRTGKVVPPHPLESGVGSQESGVRKSSNSASLTPAPRLLTPDPDSDPRVALADWLTSPDNRWFSRAIANRLWAHFFGRGLVEPIDDMRDTSPASNEPLLAALSRFTVQQEFDLKQLIRAIANSQVYQLSSAPNASNERDDQNFSRMAMKSVPAEVLLDAICQATARPEKFELLPDGTRAIQLWDNRVNHYFLQVFGRPLRATACECERMNEPSVAQVLHLMNSPEIQTKISHPRGRVQQLLRSAQTTTAIVDELYLATYSRLPRDHERDSAVGYLDAAAAGARTHAAEDLLWTLMNTTEFLFNH